MNKHAALLRVASAVAEMSKDPSTRVGAIIVDPIGRIVSAGYNGFARGCDDSPEMYADREKKYSRTSHAETNAILFAKADLTKHSIYCTMAPCDRCAVMIIQSGITNVFCPPLPADAAPRWAEAVKSAREMFREACVIVHEVSQ